MLGKWSREMGQCGGGRGQGETAVSLALMQFFLYEQINHFCPSRESSDDTRDLSSGLLLSHTGLTPLSSCSGGGYSR